MKAHCYGCGKKRLGNAIVDRKGKAVFTCDNNGHHTLYEIQGKGKKAKWVAVVSLEAAK